MPPPNPMNPMGPPQMGPPGAPQGPKNSGLAIASLVTGILSLFPGCCCGFVGIPLALVALVMGIISIQQINASAGQMGGKGMAIAGTVLGGVAVAVDILAIVFNASSQIMQNLHT